MTKLEVSITSGGNKREKNTVTSLGHFSSLTSMHKGMKHVISRLTKKCLYKKGLKINSELYLSSFHDQHMKEYIRVQVMLRVALTLKVLNF